MSTKIRLARGGRKKSPFFRIVVANSTSPRDGRFIEKVGTYNPLLENNENRIILNKERVEYWLGVGAKPSERVSIFLNQLGVKGADKYKADFEPRKKGHGAKKKAQELAAKAAENQKKKEEEEKAAKLAAKEAKKSEVKTEEKPKVEASTEASTEAEAKPSEVKVEKEEKSA